MCLDIFLMSLSSEEHQAINHRIKPLTHKLHPLISWDISSKFYWDTIAKGKKTKDLEVLTQFSKKYDWNINLEKLLTQSYQALVLTSPDRIIRWVNPGFSTMTGYSAKYAIHKTPSFLQGKNTSNAGKEKIKAQLKRDIIFSEKIINYRKNKEEYLCEVQIFPIKNRQNQLIHFLALESETI